MTRAVVTSIVLAALAWGARPLDLEAEQYAYVRPSASGRVYFRMSPDPVATVDRGNGSGRMMRCRPGDDELLWTTRGWYAHNVYVFDDGQRLVRQANWPRGTGPEPGDLAFEFVGPSGPVRRHDIVDLMHDADDVDRTSSHYEFVDREHPLGIRRDDEGREVFECTLTDGSWYVFDSDGAVVASGVGDAR